MRFVGPCGNSRARSIKTRIETVKLPRVRGRPKKIREQDPLKQGLKPIFTCAHCDTFKDSRARSTKTRIETETLKILHYKDRIIREQDPLKQGLKLLSTSLPGVT